MKVKVSEQLYRTVGASKMAPFAVVEEGKFGWQKFVEVDLDTFSVAQLKKFSDLIKSHRDVRGTPTLLYDIATWIKALERRGFAKPRTVQHFYALLLKYLGEALGHRLYAKDEDRDVWFAYYVGDVGYVPEHKGRDGITPAHVTMNLFWEEFGGRHSASKTFWPDDCVGMPVEEALLRESYIIETPDLRDQYLQDRTKFLAEVGQVGKQFLATGVATDDLDGNKERSDGWWRPRARTICLDREGESSHVVIDVFRETDEEDRDRDKHFSEWFWTHQHDKGDEEDREDLSPEDVDQKPIIEVPLHPMLACFDLRRHLRLRIHVGQLTEYCYDKTLGEKLVLPDDSRALVEILLGQTGEFKDIIAGKGAGMVILCAGPPGTGKTLTAEVYAEVMARPLYTVQCSQLGVSPDELENELLKVFVRSQRWKAILLLDEADVYVSARGRDLTQNAIVGVFLRTLEYYKGVLFLTTNRSDLVDDAVASRCVARITYAVPSPQDQKRIWRILADTSGVKLADETIDGVVAKFPTLSGRDVKNLLKLAFLIAESRGEDVTFKLIDFVQRFKPTETEGSSHAR